MFSLNFNVLSLCLLHQLLRSGGKDTRGSHVVLITDAVETASPYINETLPSIKAAGVTIHTITLAEWTDHNITDVSTATGNQRESCFGWN